MHSINLRVHCHFEFCPVTARRNCGTVWMWIAKIFSTFCIDAKILVKFTFQGVLIQPGRKTFQYVIYTRNGNETNRLIDSNNWPISLYQNSYLGQVQRGEKKMKRFVRCAGGEQWEDPSLAEWDPNDFRVFCGDLGNEVNIWRFCKTGPSQKLCSVRRGF